MKPAGRRRYGAGVEVLAENPVAAGRRSDEGFFGDRLNFSDFGHARNKRVADTMTTWTPAGSRNYTVISFAV